MNQALNEHRRTPNCTRCAREAGVHCRTRLENIRTKEYAGKETANPAADITLSNSGTTGQTVSTDYVNTDQIVERDDGTSGQLDENQLPTMDVSLDQKNSVESGIGGSKSVAGHQAEQANSRLSIEAMKCSANKIGEVSHQYEDYTGKL